MRKLLFTLVAIIALKSNATIDHDLGISGSYQLHVSASPYKLLGIAFEGNDRNKGKK